MIKGKIYNNNVIYIGQRTHLFHVFLQETCLLSFQFFSCYFLLHSTYGNVHIHHILFFIVYDNVWLAQWHWKIWAFIFINIFFLSICHIFLAQCFLSQVNKFSSAFSRHFWTKWFSSQSWALYTKWKKKENQEFQKAFKNQRLTFLLRQR